MKLPLRLVAAVAAVVALVLLASHKSSEAPKKAGVASGMVAPGRPALYVPVRGGDNAEKPRNETNEEARVRRAEEHAAALGTVWLERKAHELQERESALVGWLDRFSKKLDDITALVNGSSSSARKGETLIIIIFCLFYSFYLM